MYNVYLFRLLHQGRIKKSHFWRLFIIFSETGVYCDSALLNLAKHFMMNITAHGTYFVFRVIEMQLDKSSQSDLC